MKRTVMYSAMLSAMLMLTGCGSDNDTDNNNQEQITPPTPGEITPPNPDAELSSEQKQKVLAVVKETSSFSLKESLLAGVVDTLVFGTDELDEGEKCAAGGYVRDNASITFKDCEGIFKQATGLNTYQGLSAVSGTVTIQNGIYEYKDLVLLNRLTGESKTLTGKLIMTGNDYASVITADNLTFKANEKRADKFSEAHYILKDYQINYDKKNATELALSTRGSLSAVNSSVGDFNIKFKTTQSLIVRIDSKNDDAVSSYPYAGVIEVEDLTHKITTTYSSNTDMKTAYYSVKLNAKEIEKGTKNWTEILGYSD